MKASCKQEPDHSESHIILMFRYPTSEQYAAACRTLVTSYSILEDKVKAGRKNGQTYVSAYVQDNKSHKEKFCRNSNAIMSAWHAVKF